MAALGTWYVASGANRAPVAHHVVATRLIGPGERIGAADIELAPIDLPEAFRAVVFTRTEGVVGTVALGPIGPGELVQASAVTAGGDPAGAEVSFSVDAEWAAGGDLRPGDRIDLYATEDRAAGSGDGPEGGGGTRRVLAAAVVRAVTRPDDALGRSRSLTITVVIDDPELLPRAVHAARTAALTVVRVTDAVEDREDDEPDRDGEDETDDDAGGGS